MTTERSGLTHRPDMDSAAMEIVQMPWVAWIFLGMGALFGLFAAGTVMPWLMPVWGAGMVLLALGLTASAFTSRRLGVDISPTTVELTGWMGRLPLPGRTVRLPLLGTDLEWSRGAQVNDVQIWSMRVLHQGEVVAHIPSLRCTQAELQGIRDRLQDMRERALELEGAGADEVPDDLERMVRARSAREDAR